MEATNVESVPLEAAVLGSAASLTRAVDSALAGLTATTESSLSGKVAGQATVTRGKTRQAKAVRTEKVVLIGQGYIGLPVAIRAVEAGFRVVGLDVDADRVAKLTAGESYVEDINSSRLGAALQTGRYKPTCDYADAEGFDVCVISVPTPLRDGVPDLSYVEQAGTELARYVTRGCTVILESTTYPGTTEDLLRPLLEVGSGLRAPGDFFLGYSPERIDPGNPAWHLENTPKIVSGIDYASLDKVDGFFRRIVGRTVPVNSTRVAELAKLLENTFRTVNIALVNELAIFADQLGIDVWEAIEAARTKPFGYMPFYPGPGVGGHCLPIDPAYLSWQVKRALGQQFRFVELANDINHHMPAYVVQRVIRCLNARGLPLRDRRVLLLGLAYKKNTGDMRDSPAEDVAARLVRLGAQVRAVEPHAAANRVPENVRLTELTDAELRAADIVVILSDHDCFDYGLVQRAAQQVFDTRNRCTGTNVEKL